MNRYIAVDGRDLVQHKWHKRQSRESIAEKRKISPMNSEGDDKARKGAIFDGYHSEIALKTGSPFGLQFRPGSNSMEIAEARDSPYPLRAVRISMTFSAQ